MAAGGVSLDTCVWSLNEPKPASSTYEGLRVASNALGPRVDDFEVEVARSRLDQAERELDSLKSRINYLEARAASSVGATQRELEELMQVRDALGVGAADVGELSNRLDQLTQRSGALLEWDGDDY